MLLPTRGLRRDWTLFQYIPDLRGETVRTSASLRFKTSRRQTRDVVCLAGITRSASSQPAGRTVLSKKTTFLQRCAIAQERLQPWFPHMAACIVCSYLPALRLSWPTVTLNVTVLGYRGSGLVT